MTALAEFEAGVMNGKAVECGRFAGSMRRFLMREHLGLLGDGEKGEKKVRDPVISSFYRDLWLRSATTNTKAYDDAFLVVPTDKVKTMEECIKYEGRTPVAEFDRSVAKDILDVVKVLDC
jgi:hypothetical protein